MHYLKDINSKKVQKLVKDSSTWCKLSINETEVKAKIKHIGREKFRIITDKSGDKYANIIVGASDVFH
jgi:hypothetical protein